MCFEGRAQVLSENLNVHSNEFLIHEMFQVLRSNFKCPNLATVIKVHSLGLRLLKLPISSWNRMTKKMSVYSYCYFTVRYSLEEEHVRIKCDNDYCRAHCDALSLSIIKAFKIFGAYAKLYERSLNHSQSIKTPSASLNVGNHMNVRFNSRLHN